MINATHISSSLFSSLDDLLNQQHPLYKLSHKINWFVFEQAFTSLYCLDNGRPAKPIRLICGLLILKHLRNISDESVVEQWGENTYFQYFCGMHEFVPSFPCNESEPVHFRKRIGEKGIELILAESIRKGKEHKKYEFGNKFPSYAPPQVSFLAPALFATNTMDIGLKRVWNRCTG